MGLEKAGVPYLSPPFLWPIIPSYLEGGGQHPGLGEALCRGVQLQQGHHLRHVAERAAECGVQWRRPACAGGN